MWKEPQLESGRRSTMPNRGVFACSRRGTEGSNPAPSSRESVSRGTLSSCVKSPAFRAGVAGLRSRRGRQSAVGPANIAPTCGNISAGLYSSTVISGDAVANNLLVKSKSQGGFPTEGRASSGLGDAGGSCEFGMRLKRKPSAAR